MIHCGRFGGSPCGLRLCDFDVAVFVDYFYKKTVFEYRELK